MWTKVNDVEFDRIVRAECGTEWSIEVCRSDGYLSAYRVKKGSVKLRIGKFVDKQFYIRTAVLRRHQ